EPVLRTFPRSYLAISHLLLHVTHIFHTLRVASVACAARFAKRFDPYYYGGGRNSSPERPRPGLLVAGLQ
ncbi:MAG TPA: hypothetical protein PKH89_11915, partial [Anaerolineae bacterium]|nr:hypothetical protein [Anaerolineae bacterium]